MRKFFVFVILLTVFLTSCRENTVLAEDIAKKVLANNVIPYAKHYEFGVGDYTDKYLDGSFSKKLYGCDINEYCSDFFVALSKKDAVAELHILIARSEDKAELLKNRLKERADTLMDKEIYLYDSEKAESINAMVYQKGLYVCLVAGDKSEIMYEKLCDILN